MPETDIPIPVRFDDTEVAFAYKSTNKLHKAKILFKTINHEKLVDWGTKFVEIALQYHIPFVKTAFKSTIYEQFCGGETLEETQKVIDKLGTFGVKVLLDYGVEAKETEYDFDEAAKQIAKAIKHAREDDQVHAVSSKISGLARFDLLQKISEDKPLKKKELDELENVKKRLQKICKAADKYKVAIYFDAEETWVQPAIDAFVLEMMEQYNVEQSIIFNTYQLYRHDRLEFLKENHAASKKKGYILAAKLVRGAYMEKERERAAKMGYPSPIQPDKEATDRDYNLALAYCVEHLDTMTVCCASHNEKSNAFLCQLIEEKQLDRNYSHIYFSQLYGMSDNISFNLANAGYNIFKYLPYGPVKEVIPYLIRRADENTAVSGQMGRELSLIVNELDRRKRLK
ncbi:MAG: proline dehydrogenase family protein [Chitinophagales bacterium]